MLTQFFLRHRTSEFTHRHPSSRPPDYRAASQVLIGSDGAINAFLRRSMQLAADVAGPSDNE